MEAVTRVIAHKPKFGAGKVSSRGLRIRSTLLPFSAALIVMLGAWALLAVLYSGIGGGPNVLEARGVISAVTSTSARAGNLEVKGILATPEYFRASGRGDEIFGLAPEENLATITRSPGAFDVFDQSADALDVDPDVMLPVLLVVDIHEGELPEPDAWISAVSMTANGVALPPAQTYSTAFRSEHHQTLALQFPREDASGEPVSIEDAGKLSLTVPNIESGNGKLTVDWALPLDYPAQGGGGVLSGSAATLGSVLAIMAGFLVIFSPCVVHMTAYFLPVITGLGMQEIKARKGDVRFRAHVAFSGVAFVAGFVILYTAFGVAAGFAGQFFSNTSKLEPYLLPVRVITGAVVIYLALQTLGVFRLPFILSLRLPGRPHKENPRQGYIAAMIAGMSISLGCLVCVGGTLLASLLVYAGASASPLVGGLTLFLFSVGMSMPFLLAAFAYDKVLPRFRAAWGLVRYSTPVAGAAMLVLGLLILSGSDSIFERLVV